MKVFGALLCGPILLIALGSSNAAAGQTPETTQTPQVVLALPDLLQVQSSIVTWEERSQGEDGYRLTATIGTETRTFELPADSNRFEFPRDFVASCNGPRAPNVEVTVAAFKGSDVGPAATGSNAVLCPPLPQATASAPVPRLPATGAGDRPDARQVAWVFPVLAMAATGCLVFSALLALRARTR